MVSGRIALLFTALFGTVFLVLFERAVGLPVATCLVLPAMYRVLQRPERSVYILTLVVAVAVVFATPILIAGVFVVAMVAVQPVMTVLIPQSLAAVVRVVTVIGLLVMFALSAQVPFSGLISVYAICVLVGAAWWGQRRQKQLRLSSGDREQVVVFS